MTMASDRDTLRPENLCGEVMATCRNEPGHPGDHWNPTLVSPAQTGLAASSSPHRAASGSGAPDPAFDANSMLEGARATRAAMLRDAETLRAIVEDVRDRLADRGQPQNPEWARLILDRLTPDTEGSSTAGDEP